MKLSKTALALRGIEPMSVDSLVTYYRLSNDCLYGVGIYNKYLSVWLQALKPDLV